MHSPVVIGEVSLFTLTGLVAFNGRPSHLLRKLEPGKLFPDAAFFVGVGLGQQQTVPPKELGRRFGLFAEPIVGAASQFFSPKLQL